MEEKLLEEFVKSYLMGELIDAVKNIDGEKVIISMGGQNKDYKLGHMGGGRP